MSRALSLVDIIEQLTELPVGTRFVTDYGSKLYVSTQTEPNPDNQKVLKWESSNQMVGITEITVEATYHLIPDYVEISWQEAFEMIKEAVESFHPRTTGVFIEGQIGGFQAITTIDDFEEDLDIEDFSDLFRMTFYKSNK